MSIKNGIDKIRETLVRTKHGEGEERNDTYMYYSLRLLLGAYLVYLAYDMIKNRPTDGSTKTWVIIVFFVIFAVIGLYVAVTCLRILLKHEYYDPKRDQEEEMKTQAELERRRQLREIEEACREDAERRLAQEAAAENADVQAEEPADQTQEPDDETLDTGKEGQTD